MRLLVVTQAVDQDDPALGFFHGWIEELARRYEHVYVLCLKKGKYELPHNVSVYSLGKESGASRVSYVWRLFCFIVSHARSYKTVFVHQNQEYILIAGWLWKLLGKKIFMWRNHYAGSTLTDIAAFFCTAVFCTSTHSYTARYKKTVLMPIGVDLHTFHSSLDRRSRSILFLARIAPSKHPDVLVEALGLLKERGTEYSAALYGSPLPIDAPYHASLVERAEALGLQHVFHAGVPHSATPSLYAAHDIFVNLSASGMYDKTLFEAAASGCIVVAASKDFAKEVGSGFLFSVDDVHSLVRVLEKALTLGVEERERTSTRLRALAEAHSLSKLGERLAEEMTI